MTAPPAWAGYSSTPEAPPGALPGSCGQAWDRSVGAAPADTAVQDASDRWLQAADLLRTAGRTPGGLRTWLGAGWSGPAADSFGEWATSLETATRHAAAALADAAAAVRAGGLGPGLLDQLDAAAHRVDPVGVPGRRQQQTPTRAARHAPTAGGDPRARARPQPATARPGADHPRHTAAGRLLPERVHDWITDAVVILRQEGYGPDQVDADSLATIIKHESGGNPAAVNRGDANAAHGNPSTGLMQTVPSTFARYHLPGHGHILDPVDNIIAGARYAVARYGSTSQVPGVMSVAAGHGYRGY